MSWPVTVMAFTSPPPSMSEMDPNWEPQIIGTIDEVRARISAHLPGVDWSEGDCGVYLGNGFTFEFAVGLDKDPTRTRYFVVHVRGHGDAIADLFKFARPNGWYLLDGSTGEWLDFENPSQSGWRASQEYADQIRAHGGESKGGG